MEEILIVMDGGVIQNIIFPPESKTKIVVKDYDIEDYLEEDLETDSEGNKFLKSEWEGNR